MTEKPAIDIPDFTGFKQFGTGLAVAVFGANGGIGRAFVAHLAADPAVDRIYAFARNGETHEADKVIVHTYDPFDDASLSAAASLIRDQGPLHLGISAIGLLHDDASGLAPEKSWRDLDADTLLQVYRANAVAPTMVMKHMLPLLPRDRRAGFAALSARVGSISDNRIGGWYGYRAAKAALNQHIRCASVELARKYDQAFCVGLHPGTVDTGLSKPFQKHVAGNKLFSPTFSAGAMLQVLDRLTTKQSGRLFAYDGQEIDP